MYCFKLVNLDPARLEKVKWILDQGIVNKDVWLAGGSIRTVVDHNEEVIDYDLFFRNHPRFSNPESIVVKETREKLIQLGFKLTFECPEGMLYTYERDYCTYCEMKATAACFETQIDIQQVIVIKQKVQLICEHFYSSPEELLATFDLTPCLFATDGVHLWTYKSAIKGVNKKQVRLYKLTYPIATMRRIIKYAKKGYNTNLVCKDFVSNLMERGNIQLSEDQLRVYID